MMGYEQTVSFLFSQFANYQKIGKSAYKPSLDNILYLSKKLGNPHKNTRFIHLAGTNGKGSTASMISSVLSESGYKVGLFTSPHLVDFRERITIGGRYISKDFICDFVSEHRSFFEKSKASFFEWCMLLAFVYFQNENVDVAVIETGLGGRLDATNIITPILSIITSIGLDHKEMLGDNLEDIAKEKSGIIKPKTPYIIGKSIKGNVEKSICEIGDKQNAPFLPLDENMPIYPCDLKGEVQKDNQILAQNALNHLRGIFEKITDLSIKKGLANIGKNTPLKGRFEIINQRPFTVLDVAHNAQAIQNVLASIELEIYDECHFVFGVLKDKSMDDILAILPQKGTYYLCSPKTQRAMEVDELSKLFVKHRHRCFETCVEAYKEALKTAKETDLIVIFGSHFVVSEIHSYQKSPSKTMG